MTVYVTGHKNPDTDSVTAAIAYAELLKAGGQDAVPAMQGEMNPETQAVLGGPQGRGSQDGDRPVRVHRRL